MALLCGIKAERNVYLMFDFSDKVILVTGSAGNLGSAVAYRFDSAGAQLALFDRHPDRLEKVFRDLNKSTDHRLAHN